MLECNTETELIKQAEKTAACLTEKLKEHSLTLALAESCTAGLISSLLANIPGVSAVLWGSFVCYTKEAKVLMLGLDKNQLDTCGTVSGETAGCMEECVLQKSGVNIAASVTGLAGPGGDGSNTATGTVWIATAFQNGGIETENLHFSGTRNEIRLRSAIALLEMLINRLDKTKGFY